MNKQCQQEIILFDKMSPAYLSDVIALEQQIFTCPWTKEMFHSEYFDNHLSSSFVAKCGEQVIGYLIFWEVVGEYHLMNLAIHPAWQRRGIGELWLTWLLKTGRERGMISVTLEVRAGNLPALSLYQKLGFCKVGLRKYYYRSPVEDALLLTYTF